MMTSNNISSIVDLEWCCSLPIEMHQPRFWLSGQEGNDFLKDDDGQAEKVATFLATYKEFLDILGVEQKRRSFSSRLAFDPKSIIQGALEKKSYWYFAAVSHPRNAYTFLIEYIQPMFAPAHTEPEAAGKFQDTFAPYYAASAMSLVRQKV